MRLIHEHVALARDDVCAGVPLRFDLYDAGGAALLPAGTVLRDPAQHALLFDHFRPVRRRDDAEPGPTAHDPVPAARHLGLSAGAAIGIRRRVGATRALQRCRLIGVGASGVLFVEPQPAVELEFACGDDVEAVAIGRSAVSRFGATVEAVHAAGGAPFLVLSRPGFVDRLRTRAEPRVPVRIAAWCSGARTSADGIGIVRDLSLNGLSVAVDSPLAAAGEPLSIQLPYADGDRVALLTLDATVRAAHADPAAPGWTLHHVAFGDTAAAERTRLKALLFDLSTGAADTERIG
ncbi:PilZ domain-containing protein [Burkholderia sp. AU28942]|uniref:PilZ domain-containing protein n=1 Tax=Burkholderia TaxID=32008 RepID=UPI000841D43A|nr:MULTISPECIES: PilZ domain-containing protein [Burkholderia]AOK07579.1 pilus assembly protein PilZ [Burkholderia latens]MCA8308912.1 PilZ domain-containing protein [Burkholderia sp. AU28942]